MQTIKHVPIECTTVAETPDRALGDGTGIIMVAETSTGCLLGASGIGERGVPAEHIAGTAADELIDAVSSGACVDQWCAHLTCPRYKTSGSTSADLHSPLLDVVTSYKMSYSYKMLYLAGYVSW